MQPKSEQLAKQKRDLQNLRTASQSRAQKDVFGAGIILLKLIKIIDGRIKAQSSIKYLGNKYPKFQRAVEKKERKALKKKKQIVLDY